MFKFISRVASLQSALLLLVFVFFFYFGMSSFCASALTALLSFNLCGLVFHSTMGLLFFYGAIVMACIVFKMIVFGTEHIKLTEVMANITVSMGLAGFFFYFLC